jgi:hypothetical protein
MPREAPRPAKRARAGVGPDAVVAQHVGIEAALLDKPSPDRGACGLPEDLLARFDVLPERRGRLASRCRRWLASDRWRPFRRR